MTVKLLVAVRFGLTRSYRSVLVTTVVIVFVPGPCGRVGVQVMTPAALMLTPGGGLTSS